MKNNIQHGVTLHYLYLQCVWRSHRQFRALMGWWLRWILP